MDLKPRKLDCERRQLVSPDIKAQEYLYQKTTTHSREEPARETIKQIFVMFVRTIRSVLLLRLELSANYIC